MLMVSDSVTALLPIFSTNEEGWEGIFCTDLFNDKLHFGGYNTIQLWWVLSTVPTQQHGDDDDDLIGGTSIAII